VNQPGRRLASRAVDAEVETIALLERLLEELRALREEAARQTALLEAVLAKLVEIERTQYS
jgi:hypothetical protein